MVFDPISKALLDGVHECVKQEIEEEAKKKNPYWVSSPPCGRRVVKKECYVCGWQQTRNKEPDSGPYRINCPGGGTKVVKEELLKKGCYICEYKLTEG